MFRIEVEKKERSEQFNFEDVEKTAKVFHEDCCDGNVEWKSSGEDNRSWTFECQRCHKLAGLKGASSLRPIVITTAVTGKKGEIRKQEAGHEGIYVVQKE